MFRLIKKVFNALLIFSGSLASMANVSNYTKCLSLNNQSCMTRPTLIDFNPDEHNQRLSYYAFMANINRCNEVVIFLMIHLVKYCSKHNRRCRFKLF